MPEWIGLLILGIGVFGISYHYSKRFLDWLRFQSLGTRDYIVDKLQMMFIDVPSHKVLIALFAMSFGLGSFVFLSFLPHLVPGFIFGAAATALGWKAPKPIVDWYYRRRVKKFVVQMIDALALMSNGLKSGLSVVQALGLVTQEMPDPIQQEFNEVLRQNKIGVPLEEAFTSLGERIKSDDVEMFVTSVNILKETGGNLAETFDTIVMTIRERIKIENKIDALTTQGFYQGVFVMAIPPILGTVFYSSDPAFMRPLFTTTLGWVIVMGIVALEAVGFFAIMKIIKIDV
jgi:tight adherence protein B